MVLTSNRATRLTWVTSAGSGNTTVKTLYSRIYSVKLVRCSMSRPVYRRRSWSVRPSTMSLEELSTLGTRSGPVEGALVARVLWWVPEEVSSELELILVRLAEESFLRQITNPDRQPVRSVSHRRSTSCMASVRAMAVYHTPRWQTAWRVKRRCTVWWDLWRTPRPVLLPLFCSARLILTSVNRPSTLSDFCPRRTALAV